VSRRGEQTRKSNKKSYDSESEYSYKEEFKDMSNCKHDPTEDFMKLFNGRDDLVGKYTGYQNLLTYLKEAMEEGGAERVRRVIYACIVVSEQPLKWVLTGKTKSGKGDGRALNSDIAQYLPTLSAQNREGLDGIFEARRKKGFREEFVFMNVTMVRRISMISQEYMNPSESKLIDSLRTKYGAKPSLLNETSPSIMALDDVGEPDDKSDHTKTFKIKVQQLGEHGRDNSYWNTDEFKEFYQNFRNKS
jgi:hypothetical protein